MPHHVAIFGATSAIASELARRYAREGARLYLVGRNRDKLAALLRELEGSVVDSAIQDFDHTEAAEACVRRAVESLGALDLAIIAHGSLGDQLESERSYSEAEQIARANYLSVVALLIPLANELERRRCGQLVVLSSVAAERGRPRNYTYAAAKSALNVYLQGLRSRLYRAGVSVHTIKLGPVDTPMTASHEKNLLFSSAPNVASEIMRAVARRRPEPFVPGFWRPLMFGVRNVPEFLFQRVRGLSAR